jgi:hypothetical protein
MGCLITGISSSVNSGIFKPFLFELLNIFINNLAEKASF